MHNDGQLRCAHGHLGKVKEEDGWKVPYAGDKCLACNGAQIGLAYKGGEPCRRGEGPPASALPAPIPEVVCVETEGCVLLVGGGPHAAPCLTETGERLPYGGDDRDMVGPW